PLGSPLNPTHLRWGCCMHYCGAPDARGSQLRGVVRPSAASGTFPRLGSIHSMSRIARRLEDFRMRSNRGSEFKSDHDFGKLQRYSLDKLLSLRWRQKTAHHETTSLRIAEFHRGFVSTMDICVKAHVEEPTDSAYLLDVDVRLLSQVSLCLHQVLAAHVT